MKICTVCGKEKTAAEFYKSKNKDGLHSWCKKCCCAKKKTSNEKRRLEVGDEVWLARRVEYVRTYQKKNPYATWLMYRRQALRKSGWTVESYLAAYENQEGRCFLCGKWCPLPAPGQTSQEVLHADHDHLTGRPRALLCHSHNLALGGFGDDVLILKKAIEYIEKFRREGC